MQKEAEKHAPASFSNPGTLQTVIVGGGGVVISEITIQFIMTPQFTTFYDQLYEDFQNYPNSCSFWPILNFFYLPPTVTTWRASSIPTLDFFICELNERDRTALAKPVVRQRRTSQESNILIVPYQI